jgi:hypothetical protein
MRKMSSITELKEIKENREELIKKLQLICKLVEKKEIVQAKKELSSLEIFDEEEEKF